MRETGLSASNLLKMASEKIANKALAAEVDERYAKALNQLNFLVRTGQLVAWGRPSDTRNKPMLARPRQPIRADLIDELRTIDAWGFFRSSQEPDPGPFFYDVCFRIAEVKQLFPAEPAEFPPSQRIELSVDSDTHISTRTPTPEPASETSCPYPA